MLNPDRQFDLGQNRLDLADRSPRPTVSTWRPMRMEERNAFDIRFGGTI